MTPWTAAHQASLSFTISPSLFKLMSIESVISSNHLILCHPLLLSIVPSIQALGLVQGDHQEPQKGSEQVQWTKPWAGIRGPVPVFCPWLIPLPRWNCTPALSGFGHPTHGRCSRNVFRFWGEGRRECQLAGGGVARRSHTLSFYN